MQPLLTARGQTRYFGTPYMMNSVVTYLSRALMDVVSACFAAMSFVVQKAMDLTLDALYIAFDIFDFVVLFFLR